MLFLYVALITIDGAMVHAVPISLQLPCHTELFRVSGLVLKMERIPNSTAEPACRLNVPQSQRTEQTTLQ